MVILLPGTRGGLPSLEKRFGAAELSRWLASLDSSGPQELDVTLPRFEMTYAADLEKPLEQLGVAAAFAPDVADFSRINGDRELSVSNVLHKAYIDVSEQGTEAAAVTGIAVLAASVPVPRKFPVDHPFIFLIRDASTGSLLFLGRVVDPRTS